jgi:hypothetical protein
VALLHLQSHMRARRVEVSGDASEGGASRSRMDPGSTGVAAWLGFIDLAPSSATTKEGTAPRVMVPPQPSRAGRRAVVPCGDGPTDLRLTGATKSSRMAAPPQPSRALGRWCNGHPGGCSAVAARLKRRKQTTLLRRNISEAGHG